MESVYILIVKDLIKRKITEHNEFFKNEHCLFWDFIKKEKVLDILLSDSSRKEEKIDKISKLLNEDVNF